MESFYPKGNWVKWKSRIEESVESLIKWVFEKTVNKSWQSRCNGSHIYCGNSFFCHNPTAYFQYFFFRRNRSAQLLSPSSLFYSPFPLSLFSFFNMNIVHVNILYNICQVFSPVFQFFSLLSFYNFKRTDSQKRIGSFISPHNIIL